MIIDDINDKIKHIIVSMFMVLMFAWFVGALMAIAIVAVVGLSKEYIWDRLLRRGKFDYCDLMADFTGILIGVVIYMLVV